MTSPSFLQLRILTLLLLRARTFGLNSDGVLLLSFNHSIDRALSSWNTGDDTPCSWSGITCDRYSRVTGLSLPNSGLVGPIPSTLAMIESLRDLNLSGNSINRSIPSSLFSASKLQLLDLSNNLISGGLPELVGELKNLQVLNLSSNALSGRLPESLSTLQNLKAISLSDNYFSGSIPGGFSSVRVLDLSSNLINGSLPPDFGGDRLTCLNVSFNMISGEIPPEFSQHIPGNASLDLSFNNLTGRISDSDLFFRQDKKSYAGNPELCGEPLRNPCPISSVNPPSATAQESPAAIPAIPTNLKSTSATGNILKRLTPRTILCIAAGVGTLILVSLLLSVYILRRRRKTQNYSVEEEAETRPRNFHSASSESSSEEDNRLIREWTCLKLARHATSEEDEQTNSEHTHGEKRVSGALVTLDGEKELELETLLKASAYILGTPGSSIMYKTVLEDGTTLAVRRVGENGVERFRDFQNQIKVISKLVHPNLVRIRGFYWGADEKLIIYDYVPNGSLANARYRKAPYHIPWELRLKIAKGVARGLCYIHEKKQVHGNLNPNNILLGLDMEPKIGDFGLQRLVSGDKSSKGYFGSKRSTVSRESFQEFGSGGLPSPSPSVIGGLPYHAPESLRSMEASSKWDVFSFGVVLLELVTGKVVVHEETGAALDEGRALRMAEGSIRGEVEGKEEALLGLLRLGYSCISPVPQRRPSMKESLHALDKFPS